MATEHYGNQAPFDASKPPLRVLALDGGGMRGYYTVAVQQKLCERFASQNSDGAKFDFGQAFHVIVGSSTGSIIAACLALGCSPIEITRFYDLWGPKIFANPVPDFESMHPKIRTASFLWFMFRNARKPFNSDAPIREGLREIFGDETFGTLWGTRRIALLIPAVDMQTHNAWVFKTSHIEGKHRDENVPLVDACLASSAAPYFFPLAFRERPFADGGLVANNPMLMGAIEAMEMTPNERDRRIEIISIGTCPPPVGTHATEATRRWGFEQWQVVRGFSETVLDAQVSMHVYTIRFLLHHLDRRIDVFRLHQSAPNEDEAPKLGLDRADDEARGILWRRGETDALQIHSHVRDNPEFAPISDIFSNITIKED